MNDADVVPDTALSLPTNVRAGTREVGEYTRDMLLELRGLAVKAGCSYLAYLVELALIESSNLAAGRAPSGFAARQGTERPEVDVDAIVERILAAKA